MIRMVYVPTASTEDAAAREADAQWFKDHAEVHETAMNVHADSHAQYAAARH
jgi:hypothetical protein